MNKYIDLQIHPGQIVISVPVRMECQKEKKNKVNFGKEGVWYLGLTYSHDTPIPLEPSDKEGYSYSFTLCPQPGRLCDEILKHTYLVRYLDNSTSYNLIQNMLITISWVAGQNKDDKRWDLSYDSISLIGIDYDCRDI